MAKTSNELRRADIKVHMHGEVRTMRLRFSNPDNASFNGEPKRKPALRSCNPDNAYFNNKPR